MKGGRFFAVEKISRERGSGSNFQPIRFELFESNMVDVITGVDNAGLDRYDSRVATLNRNFDFMTNKDKILLACEASEVKFAFILIKSK